MTPYFVSHHNTNFILLILKNPLNDYHIVVLGYFNQFQNMVEGEVVEFVMHCGEGLDELFK